MAGLVQLCSSRQTGGARTYHGDLLAGAGARRLGYDPTFLEAAVGDGIFDILDRDRGLDGAQYAGTLAGRRADPAGEFGEIVGRMQDPEGFPPLPAIDQIVPVRDDVVDRTTAVAIGDMP